MEESSPSAPPAGRGRGLLGLSPFPPPPSSSRRPSHARDRGGCAYGLGVVWAQLRPFLPFFLISCLVVLLVFLLHRIVHSGPFTDPLFFHRFDQRRPRPGPGPDTGPPGNRT